MIEKSLVDRAREYATEKHKLQFRKYTNEPYINHPSNIVKILNGIKCPPEMIAAAWLHDTVEDTDTTIEEIKEKFGDDVAELVDMLTNRSVTLGITGNREMRKKIDIEYLANASPEAQTIKLADMIDNLPSIIEHDPGFAKVYVKEKTELLNVLTKGDERLWILASHIIYRFNEE